MNNTQKILKFLGKLLVLVLLVGILDFILGSFVEYLYFRQGNNWYSSSTYVIEKAKQDILIFGSSRAKHHYVPEILNAETGLSCYNAGCDGQSILFDYALLKSVLNRYKPKKVILDLSKFSLFFDQSNYDKLAHLYPYYRDNENVREIVDLNKHHSKYILLSKLYTFNSTILVILKSFYKPWVDYNGYIPFPGNPTMDRSEITYDSLGLEKYLDMTAEYRLDENKINVLNRFIELTHNQNIDLYVIESPYFFLQQNSDNISFNKIKEILDAKGIKYYNFSNDDRFLLKPDLFGDGSHLNHFGAEKYTKLVAEIIKDKPTYP